MAVVAQRSEKVKRYIEDTGLPFDILIDDSRETVKAYGVWHRVGFDAWNIARPALFLIDRGGIIRYAFVADHQAEFPGHEEIVEELRKLGGRSQKTEDRRQKTEKTREGHASDRQRFQLTLVGYPFCLLCFCILSSVVSAKRYRENRFAISLQFTTFHHAST